MLPLRPLLAERRRSTWFMVRFVAQAAYRRKRFGGIAALAAGVSHRCARSLQN
ncbi:MAG: hypothetical protein IKN55_07410 [Oscillospiraceae bacterium]|nr:hypothetical protein [Oscillospiraceae bacterium]